MKKIYLLLFIILTIALSGCEEVVDIDLNTAPPRLVVDASLKWQKGTSGSIQVISLSTTAPYFSDAIPVVSGATVYVTNSAGQSFDFVESDNAGEYICTDFQPVLEESYTLYVIYQDETYRAVETLKPVPSIDMIQQQDGAGFSGNDTEIKIFFTDNGATTDFYLFTLWRHGEPLPVYQVLNDLFIQGNQSFGRFSIEDAEPGDVATIILSGISEQYHNYLKILLDIAGSASGSPFQSPPVAVRGNLVNQTDVSNYAFGYFSLSETDTSEVIID